MSFLKITDPTKRDYLVQELLNTRKIIKEDSYSSHLGKIKLQERYSKQLKPVTDKLESIPTSIASVLEPTLTSIAESQAANATALAALPSNISDAIWPQLPTSEFATPPASPTPLQIEDIATPSSSLEVPQSSIEFGKIAGKYMNSVLTGKNITDTTFGIHAEEGFTWYILHGN